MYKPVQSRLIKKLCDERLHKIHSNKLNLVQSRFILPRQQLQRQNTRIQQKLKRSGADFLKLKKFLLREKTVFRVDKKRMAFICGLAIILPIYAIQNQEMPEVEMFCRHTIGGYQFDFYHRSYMYHFYQTIRGRGNTKQRFQTAQQ